ncbi:hypothetical protein BDEG_21376 [Batrachochytrium dendrobatidis JEL423]|uniref:Uncharacterized protein n=1 Tax=Batrachochytrium dendrobatidis (strain JEL423) TaxID=403673 RepID=A0A177WBD4_BATDL|nr:hypothetical protein BDEG_21376 [Batrachochytrium dendrobatidis JEL423]
MSKHTDNTSQSSKHTISFSRTGSLQNLERRNTISAVSFNLPTHATSLETRNRVYRVKSVELPSHASLAYQRRVSAAGLAPSKKKAQSEVKLQRAVSALSMYARPIHPSPPQIAWKWSTPAEKKLSTHSVVKNLPITRVYQEKLQLNNTNNLSIHLEKFANSIHSLKDLPKTLYRFLVGHLRSSVELVEKTIYEDDMKEIKCSFCNIVEDNLELFSVIKMWCSSQLTMMEIHKKRDRAISALVDQLEKLEEENLLFKNFVGSHSRYTPDHNVEIKVEQIVVAIKPSVLDKDTNTEEVFPPFTSEPHVSLTPQESAQSNLESFNLPRASIKPLSTNPNLLETSCIPSPILEPEVAQSADEKLDQSESLSNNLLLGKPSTKPGNIDVFDKACGTDRPIPLFRTTGVMVDLSHPFEAKYVQLSNDYAVLKEQKELSAIASQHAIAELTAGYQEKLSSIQETLEAKAQMLEAANIALSERVESLDTENKNYQFDISKNESEINEFKLQIAHYKKELEHLGKIQVTLQKDNESLKLNVKSAQSELKIAQELEKKWSMETEKAKSQFAAFQNQIHDFQGQLGVARIEQDAVQNDLELSRAKISELELKNCEFSAKIYRLEEKNSEMNASKFDKIVSSNIEKPKVDSDILCGFIELELSNETNSLLRHMIESNNLRIMLLEKKNEEYRRIQLKQVSTQGEECWQIYHPTSLDSILFDRASVSRPQSTASQPKSNTTYIIGSQNSTRPVSASSVVLLRPKSSLARAITPIDNKHWTLKTHGNNHDLSRSSSRASTAIASKYTRLSDQTEEQLAIVNSQLYDTHHPPLELKRYFREDELETIELLNEDTASVKDARPGSTRHEGTSDYGLKCTDEARLSSTPCFKRSSRPTTASSYTHSVQWQLK